MTSYLTPAPAGPSVRILIVDDTDDNHKLLTLVLATAGYQTLSAMDGPAALALAPEARPDLILMDIMMPGMSGYDVCRKLKQDERTKSIPVLFISALQSTTEKVKALEAGGIDFISRPFQMAEVLARIKTHLILRRLQDELERVNAELEQRVRERTAELEQLNSALERFVPREFLSFLGQDSISRLKLGDQVQQDMTILFSDIRDYTALAEGLTPQENFNFLNSYLSRISPIIRQNRGFIDKYLGDGLMALFPGGPRDAVEAALAMQAEVRRFNIRRQVQGYRPIRIGCGLHSGRLILGIIGEAERWQGTVIADAVNIASRLEGLTKEYGVELIVSGETVARLAASEHYQTRRLGAVTLKGRTEPVEAFELKAVAAG